MITSLSRELNSTLYTKFQRDKNAAILILETLQEISGDLTVSCQHDKTSDQERIAFWP
jgi:hypothetical protein